MATRSVFAKPDYLSDQKYAVIQRVAYQVAVSANPVRFQYKLLERTRHLPAFNFLRDPQRDKDIIASNTVDSDFRLTPEQHMEVHQLYETFRTSYERSKSYYQHANATTSAASAETATTYSAPAYVAQFSQAAQPAAVEQRAAVAAEAAAEPVPQQPIRQQAAAPAAHGGAGHKRSRTPTDDDE